MSANSPVYGGLSRPGKTSSQACHPERRRRLAAEVEGSLCPRRFPGTPPPPPCSCKFLIPLGMAEVVPANSSARRTSRQIPVIKGFRRWFREGEAAAGEDSDVKTAVIRTCHRSKLTVQAGQGTYPVCLSAETTLPRPSVREFRSSEESWIGRRSRLCVTRTFVSAWRG